METKSEIILPNKPVEVKGIEEAEKKIDVAENKETRAAKVRAKGEKALAEGNKDKALRLKRREEGILKRAQKKRSQASKAIEPNQNQLVMSRKEKLDLFLSRWVSRKLTVFAIASVALFSGSIESNDWVIVATAYISLQGITDIVEKLYTAKK